MFVTIATSGEYARKDASLSSASTTKMSPVPSWAPEPEVARSPPIANEGSSPQCCSATVSIDVVEVLPAVPVTAASLRPRVSAASAVERCSTVRPRSRAAASSGLLSRIAVDTTTVAGGSGRCAGSCPRCTSAPSARSASTAADSRASEPVTRSPLASRMRAIPLIPAPPMPMKWTVTPPRLLCSCACSCACGPRRARGGRVVRRRRRARSGGPPRPSPRAAPGR